MSLSADGDAQLAAGKYALISQADAVVSYSAAIQEHPESPNYYIQRAIANHKLKQYDMALTDAETAISLALQRGNKSIRASAQFRRGLALHGLGRSIDALTCLNFAARDGCPEKALDIWLTKLQNSTRNAEVVDQSTGISELPSALENSEVKHDIKISEQNSPLTDTFPDRTIKPKSVESKSPDYKHEWYQSPNRVVLTIYVKGASTEACEISCSQEHVTVKISLPQFDKAWHKTFGPLADDIVPDQCSHRVLLTKIEIVLIKRNNINWPSLERSEIPKPRPIQYPTSSTSGPKNWDKLVGEEDLGPEPEGDAALTALFQTLYNDADEDTRKAMIKSYTESGGTSLSTDWKTVKQKKVEMQAPDGMMAREYGA